MPKDRARIAEELARLAGEHMPPEDQPLIAEILTQKGFERIPFADLADPSQFPDPPPMDAIIQEIHAQLDPGEKVQFVHYVYALLAVTRALALNLGATVPIAPPRRIGGAQLTRRQMDFLRFFQEQIEATGMFPANKEIAEKFHIKQQGVPTFLSVLVDKGYVCPGKLKGDWHLTEDAVRVLALAATPPAPPSGSAPAPIKSLSETQWKILQVVHEFHSRGIYPKDCEIAQIVGFTPQNATGHFNGLTRVVHGRWGITEAGRRFIDESHKLGYTREDFGPAVEAIIAGHADSGIAL